jgi:hypothetical protein
MQCPSRKRATQQVDIPRMDTWAAIAAHLNKPQDTDDMLQSVTTQEDNECGENMKDNTDALQLTDGAMIYRRNTDSSTNRWRAGRHSTANTTHSKQL